LVKRLLFAAVFTEERCINQREDNLCLFETARSKQNVENRRAMRHPRIASAVRRKLIKLGLRLGNISLDHLSDAGNEIGEPAVVALHEGSQKLCPLGDKHGIVRYKHRYNISVRIS